MVKRFRSKSVFTWLQLSGIDTVAPGRARGDIGGLSQFEAMVLIAVGYFKPVTRGELSKILARRPAATSLVICGERVTSVPVRVVRRRTPLTRM